MARKPTRGIECGENVTRARLKNPYGFLSSELTAYSKSLRVEALTIYDEAQISIDIPRRLASLFNFFR